MIQPEIQIVRSFNASHQDGDRLKLGQTFKVKKGGLATVSCSWCGVPKISMDGETSVSLFEAGNRPNGGRFSSFWVTGEISIIVRTKNPQSGVRACFRNFFGFRGCTDLKSSVRINPQPSGNIVVGVSEGKVALQGDDGVFRHTARTGQYSVFDRQGIFSKPQNTYGVKGYKEIRRGGRQHTVLLKALPGWSFPDGSTERWGIQGVDYKMRSPVDL